VQRPTHLISDEAGRARLVDAVARSERIGLDTESNGFHAYFEKVCLLQIATPDADWALDLLAIAPGPLLELLRDPARECILHAAEYDVTSLKRDYGLVFGRIFDTHAAAKTLGFPRFGLHNLLQDTLGVSLSVDEQRSDWGKRPLSKEQLEYAFADVQYLLPLRDTLYTQLVEKRLLREAEAEFARLIAKEAKPREFDLDGWQRLKAAQTLDPKGRGILRDLFALRDRRAREIDRPPFKVISDLFMAEVARRQPKGADELARIPGASPNALRKLAPQILEVVERAEPQQRVRPQTNGQGRPPPEVAERFERLRAWRKRLADERKVEVQVIAPNAVLWNIARAEPRDATALASVEGMDAFRVESYGAAILALLAAKP
jgi:ribonuclease D